MNSGNIINYAYQIVLLKPLDFSKVQVHTLITYVTYIKRNHYDLFTGNKRKTLKWKHRN